MAWAARFRGFVGGLPASPAAAAAAAGGPAAEQNIFTAGEGVFVFVWGVCLWGSVFVQGPGCCCCLCSDACVGGGVFVCDCVVRTVHAVLCCGVLCRPLLLCHAVSCCAGTCTRGELVQVSLIGQLVIPLLTSAAESSTATQLLTLELCEALMHSAFRPQDTVLFGKLCDNV